MPVCTAPADAESEVQAAVAFTHVAHCTAAESQGFEKVRSVKSLYKRRLISCASAGSAPRLGGAGVIGER